MNTNKYIAIATYSNWEERQYKKENYIQLIKYFLKNEKLEIVLIGSNNIDEVKFNNEIQNSIKNTKLINLVGKTSILQMNSIIKNADLFIGNDSGPSNIAYIIAKKTIVFFGCVDFDYRLPVNTKLKNNILALDYKESCKYFSCYDGYNKPKCNNDDRFSCLDVVINFDNINNFLDN